MQTFLGRVWRGDATRDQAKDTGMAIVLLFLLAWMARRTNGYIALAIIAQLVTMTAPQVLRPLAVLWFGLSHVMGAVMSKVILSVIFFLVVTPIGLWRRMIGADSLKLQAFKAGRGSVMKDRNHLFVAKDLERPY